MTKNLMILGTSSGAGKSTVVSGLCRIFRQDGFQTVPFKSQNMSNNSHLLPDGREMARSQAIAAYACGVEPNADMNPILLKFGPSGLEVYVQGRFSGKMDSSTYRRDQSSLWQAILESYHRLADPADLVILEGAGSPVEMNLKPGDLANLDVAARVQAPCLLVADIDRGGMFASVYGTLMLMTPQERRLIRGIILNRLRGQSDSFAQVRQSLEEITGLPVVGMLPYAAIALEDEDSLIDAATGEKGVQTHEAMDQEFDRLADLFREHLDLEAIRRIIEEGVV